MKRTSEYLNDLAQTTKMFYELSDDERTALKKCLLEMYQDVVNVCNKYNLCIMLGGGSALGAVRHQGFIPWDDDLDAMMPRQDYNRLIAVFDEELGDRYLLSVPQTKNESASLFMKIIRKNTLMVFDEGGRDDTDGIKIDIFPIENVPENKIIRKGTGIFVEIFHFAANSYDWYRSRRQFYKKLFMRTFESKMLYWLRYCIGMLLSVIPRKTLFDAFDRFVSGGRESRYCTIPTGRKSYNGEALPKDVFFPPVQALFEGITVHIPRSAGTYLQNLYGDYMQIPPPEKRERHFYTAFSLDTAKDA